jgi:hypothetical protein
MKAHRSRPGLDLPGQEASTSFLKKEAKNFCESELAVSGKAAAGTVKSFLLLFFKKEVLA